MSTGGQPDSATSRLSTGFDYVVIGAGSAGCTLAARLSEDPSIRVCLLEAGGRDRNPFIHIPALVGAALASKSINWGFVTQPQPGLGGRRVPVPRGRVIGGTGAINGMAYFRGQPRDYDDWAAAGNAGWSWPEVLPYFLRSESNPDYAGSAYHGQDGPIRVAHVPRPNPLNSLFGEAFAELGDYPHCDDFNGPRPEGYGLRQGTIRAGRRDSSAAAYLRPALARPNLTVLTHTLASRIRLTGGRATSVDVLQNGRSLTIPAHREIILCAGAIQSPQLLLLSGIGDASQLTEHGIRVEHDLPGVGRELHDHPAIIVQWEMRDTRSYGLSLPTLPRAIGNFFQYVLARKGPLASNLFESTAFIRSSADSDRPDLQIAFQPARRNRNTFPLPLGHGFALSCVALYPRSRGQIRLACDDPRVAPLIDPNLLADDADVQVLLRGVHLARRIGATRAFAPLEAREVAPGSGCVDEMAIRSFIRERAGTVFHPVGSCRMGNSSLDVVDSQLRVRGIDGLRIADASVFPSIIGGNTNAPVVMIAEKASDLILGRPAPKPATSV